MFTQGIGGLMFDTQMDDFDIHGPVSYSLMYVTSGDGAGSGLGGGESEIRTEGAGYGRGFGTYKGNGTGYGTAYFDGGGKGWEPRHLRRFYGRTQNKIRVRQHNDA